MKNYYAPMQLAEFIADCRDHRDNSEHDKTLNAFAYYVSIRMRKDDPGFDLSRFRTLAGCPNYQLERRRST